MNQWLTTAFNDIVPSLTVAILTAYITVRLSLRSFRTERWWERKADAYSRIVESLHNAVEYFDARADAEISMRQFSEGERENHLRAEYTKATRELKKAMRIGSYIISNEVSEALARLEARPHLDPDKNSWYEIFEAEMVAYRLALDEVRRLAKKDLGI